MIGADGTEFSAGRGRIGLNQPSRTGGVRAPLASRPAWVQQGLVVP